MNLDAYAQLSRIDRHQVVLERTFRQCLKELEELQTADSADDADSGEQQNEATGREVPANETVAPPRINAPKDAGGGIPLMVL